MDDSRFILPPSKYLLAWRVGLALYLLSFLLPVSCDAGRPQGLGVSLFVWGAMYCWFPMCWPWWANLIFISALSHSKEKPTASGFVLALLAFLLAGPVFFLLFGGAMLGPAYFAWAGSMGMLALGLGVSLVPDPPAIEDESDGHPLRLPPWVRRGAQQIQNPLR